MQGTVKAPSPSDARIAGALYIACLAMGLVRGLYIPRTLFDGHAAGPPESIVANEMMFRLGMLADIAAGGRVMSSRINAGETSSGTAAP